MKIKRNKQKILIFRGDTEKEEGMKQKKERI